MEAVVMIVIKANIEDHPVLTDITKKSKAYWGYAQELLEAWTALLTITPAYIETREVYKLMVNDQTIGYYAYFIENDHTIKLDNLFILPEYIGKGYGRLLIQDLLARIKSTSFKKIKLDSDPYSEKFYAKLGFIRIGEIPTMVKDRYLPVMELKL